MTELVAHSPTMAVDNLIEVQAIRAQFEIQGAIAMAKKMPRQPARCLERIMNACMDPRFAEEALYSFPRGGQTVSGLSIRTAEMIARNWGNLDSGVVVLSQTAAESVVEAFCWDLEANWRVKRVFPVQHIRDTKNGAKVLTDQRDIYELVMNQAQRRHRACILAHIPKELQNAVEDACEKVLANDKTPLPERIKGMLVHFESLQVTREMIEKRVMKKAEALNAREVLALRRIYNSIKDGMSSVEQWFSGTERFNAESIVASGGDPDQLKPAAKPAQDEGLIIALRAQLANARNDVTARGGNPSDIVGRNFAELATPEELRMATDLLKGWMKDNPRGRGRPPGSTNKPKPAEPFPPMLPTAQAASFARASLKGEMDLCIELGGAPMQILGFNPHNLTEPDEIAAAAKKLGAWNADQESHALHSKMEE